MKLLLTLCGIAGLALIVGASAAGGHEATPYTLLTTADMSGIAGAGCATCKDPSGAYCNDCMKLSTNHSRKCFSAPNYRAMRCLATVPKTCDMNGTLTCGNGATKYWDGNENCNGAYTRTLTEACQIAEASGELCVP